MATSATQKRIFLWAVPRSISTAFFRAMMNRSNCKALLEPYSRAYYFGTERTSKRYESSGIQDGNTFSDIRALCEEPYEGYETVFVKDMAYYLVGRLQTPEFLPKGYIHTFLLRDPHKSVYSLYKMSLNKDLTGLDNKSSTSTEGDKTDVIFVDVVGWDHFEASEVGFKELYDMYLLVTQQLKQEAIIIDADDLLTHPETTFKLYCEKVGIEYEDRMLNWDESSMDLDAFQDWMPWFEGVLTSNTFKPSATKPKSPMMMPDLPRHVQKAIDDNMVYYNKMYALRLKSHTLQIL